MGALLIVVYLKSGATNETYRLEYEFTCKVLAKVCLWLGQSFFNIIYRVGRNDITTIINQLV